MHARLDAGSVQILTRRGNMWTDKYPAIAQTVAWLPAENAYLDGELCGVLPDGRTAFNLILSSSAGPNPRAADIGSLLLGYYSPDGRLIYG
jgi:bifunctional non-homologous end joining protein LigD